jgi:PadR family transcriptional regulator AphA
VKKPGYKVLCAAISTFTNLSHRDIFNCDIYHNDIQGGLEMPKVNKTKYAILGVLSIKPGSGYDIKKFCDQSIAHFWNENFGHIYPVLKLLEQEGLITKETGRTEGRPDRNVYRITPEGKSELRDWLSLPVESEPVRSELLLKLAFAENVPQENIIAQLTKAKERCAARLDEYLQIEQAFTSNQKAHGKAGYPYWLATLRYGICSARTAIQWCEETIANINSFRS